METLQPNIMHRITYLVGESIIASCNFVFGLHNRMSSIFSGTSVPNISTEALCDALDASDSKIVLVDVRSESERAISTIPGAISQQSYELKKDELANQTIVPFCTVGGRSYLYARRLVADGVSVRNYRDSILGWCRTGLPLESPEGEPTSAIHPYWRIFRVPSEYVVKTSTKG